MLTKRRLGWSLRQTLPSLRRQGEVAAGFRIEEAVKKRRLVVKHKKARIAQPLANLINQLPDRLPSSSSNQLQELKRKAKPRERLLPTKQLRVNGEND